jgi:DNA-binding transcriptional MerR regulator
MGKSEAAFRTIGEVSDELGVPQHVLRYWETRFPQLRPITRAGNRRYYRPDDVALVRRIHGLLNADGYTVKGVQKLLSARAGGATARAVPAAAAPAAPERPVLPLAELKAIRATLAEALDG